METGQNDAAKGNETYYKLVIFKAASGGQYEKQKPRYYKDKNVALVIGKNEGEGDEKFELEDFYATKLNRFMAETADGNRIQIEDSGESYTAAIGYIKKKMDVAERGVLGLS